MTAIICHRPAEDDPTIDSFEVANNRRLTSDLWSKLLKRAAEAP